jgi:inositol oxygenase
MAKALVLNTQDVEEFLSSNQTEDFTPINPNKKEDEFRNYVNSARQKSVEELYYKNHKYQTLEFVQNIKQKINFKHLKMTLWEAFEYLSKVLDESDPDTNQNQIVHGLQTAEAIRKEYPDDDWLHLTALIHDLGKVLCSPCFQLEQFAIVGDTFPVGCKFAPENIFYEHFQENPDFNHPVYGTELGIYEPHCGLMNLTMSFGHDEYLYQVLVHNKTSLPIPALYIIRFHSFYPWHKGGAYQHLTNEFDNEMFKWVKIFNRFDLYSKSHDVPKLEDYKEYYQSLMDKYIPGILEW